MQSAPNRVVIIMLAEGRRSQIQVERMIGCVVKCALFMNILPGSGARRTYLLLGLTILLGACETTPRPEKGAAASLFHPEKLAEMDAVVMQAITERKCPGGVLWLEHRGQTYHRAYGCRAVAPVVETMTE